MTRTPRIPGEPGGNPHDLAAAPAPRRVAAPPAPPPDETPEQKVARLEAEVALLRASGARVPLGDGDYARRAQGMRAADVDATRLRDSVLTQDGWVVPSFVPEPPLLRK